VVAGAKVATVVIVADTDGMKRELALQVVMGVIAEGIVSRLILKARRGIVVAGVVIATRTGSMSR
jgi:hypothetical protein